MPNDADKATNNSAGALSVHLTGLFIPDIDAG